MARLRNAVMAVALGTCVCVTGCSFAHWSPFHCDECDDFPAPAYGPDFSMMPGSYTGTPPSDSGAAARPGSSTAPGGAGASQPVEEAPPPVPAQAPATTPPTPPTAAPGMGAASRASSAGTLRLA
jgi:hypothetical protein